MRVVAQCSVSYVISLDDDLAAVKANINSGGRILLRDRRRLLPPFNIHALLSRGGWSECLLSAEETAQLLRDHGIPVVDTHDAIQGT